MQFRSTRWASVMGLFCAASALAAPQPTVAGSDMQGNGQEQQCIGRCAEEAKVLIGECLQAGGEQRDCLAAGRAFQHECERQCRGGKTCEERCERKAARAKRRCLADGGSEEHCTQVAREVLEQCIRDHCAPPPPTCESECQRRAIEVLHQCIEEGGSEEDCVMRARMFYRHCLDEHCEPPPGCHERCEQDAKAVLRLCLEMGGGEDECAERARAHLEECIKAHCPPPTCEDNCAHRALMVYRECVENGGNEDECAQHARQLYANCVRENCQNNLPCEERCRRYAAGVKRMCLEMGGSEEDCEARAQEALAQCIADCPQACGGIQGLPCDEGEFCLFPPGTCQTSDNMGVCVPIPTACPDVWQPVCGCDGQTYGNLCDALMAQVQIAHEGPCGPRPCGPSSRPCEEGFFCSFPPGSCGEGNTDNTVGGVCQPIPQACPLIYAPVCGCDGKTYGNACEAAMNGQSIRHEGECEQPCGGIGGLPCDDGEFCHFPPGTCHVVDNMGTCQPIPTACPDVWDPVCGCDGKTYGNRCEAAMAGVSIDHEGECDGQRCGSPNLPPCPDGSFCHFQPGTCGETNAGGLCEQVPDACPRIFEPVCGCDGVTYVNRCEAARARQSVKHEGPCEADRCGGIAGLPCDEGEFCKYPPGTCGCCDIFGLCTPFPLGCPDNVDPVCGCDGVTYFNPCEADAAGVSVAHPGPCAEGCDSNEDCGEHHYCHKRVGECDAATPGMCETRPQFCPEYYSPVCGCDGHTYANVCFAAHAGVSLSHEGPCHD